MAKSATGTRKKLAGDAPARPARERKATPADSPRTKAKAAKAPGRAKPPAASAVPPNIVALPLVRAAVSAFEGTADVLEGELAGEARAKAEAMREEYRRLSLLPPAQLLETYKAPEGLKLASLSGAAIRTLLPVAGDRVWAREAVGRLAALSLLHGGAATIEVPADGVRFLSLKDEAASNREAKARIGSYVELARGIMLNDRDPEARARAQKSYSAWLAEWNRLNAAEIEAASAYRPDLSDLRQATDDLKATRDHLKEIRATAEAIDTVLRVIALVAAFA